MASVGQGAKQPMLPYLHAEHDHANRSFKASSSILEKPSFCNDISVQVHTPACLSKGSTASDTFTDPPAIPHWMSSKHVQNILVSTYAKSGLTTNVAPSKPMPPPLQHNSQVRETLGQDNTRNGVQSRPDAPNSKYLFQQQPPAGSPLRVDLAPSQGFKTDEQRNELKISKNVLSLLRQKQEKKQGATDLFLGHSAGKPSHRNAEMGSWVSKFPFQIAPTVEEAEERHSIQLREPLGHRMLSDFSSEFFTSKRVANVPSRIVGSKVQTDKAKFLVHHAPSPSEVANYVVPANFPLMPPLPATLPNSNMPSLKREWAATLTECVKHPQLLPDFFAQQKVISSAKVDHCHPDKSDGDPEMKSTVLFSQKSLASRVNEENVEFNLPSLNGSICSDRAKNSSSDYQSIKQQDMGVGREEQRTQTSVFEQHLFDSLQHVDLPKAKLANLSEGSENAEWGKLASREFTDKHDKIASLEGRFLTEEPLLKGNLAADQAAGKRSSAASDIDGVMGSSLSAELILFKESASTQVVGVSTSVSVCVPSLPFSKQLQNVKHLEKDLTVPANKYTQIVGDWGEFLAAPSIGQTAEAHSKSILPFQQRFMQLQKFLQKCDRSNKEYSLQALRLLSTTAWRDHTAGLESRAVRLSLEEGKEMKRAKLLDVLEELPEGA